MLGRMTLEEMHRTLIDKLGSDAQGLRQVLASDAVVELPYAASIGMPTRLEGPDAIARYFSEVGKKLGFSNFRFSNIRAYPCADGASAWFEMHGSADLPAGKKYEQDYVQFLRVRDGKVVLYREYWNMNALPEVS